MGRGVSVCLFKTLYLGKREVFVLDSEVLSEQGGWEAAEGSSSGWGPWQGYGIEKCLRDTGGYNRFFEGTVSFGVWSLNQ